MSAASQPIALQEPKLSPVPVAPPPERPKSKRPWLFGLIAAIVAAGIAYWVAARPGQSTPAPAAVGSVKTAPVVTGPLVHTIRIAGQTSAINFANVTAPMMRGPEANREMILLQLAPGGTWVKKGTVVAAIDAQTLQDHVDDLGDTIEAAQADIRKRQAEQSVEWETLQQTVRVNKAAADKARLEYGGAEVRTEIERQLLKLSLDEAEARHKQSLADLDFKKASMAAEIRVLELTRDRHVRHRDRHARDVLAFTIRAPIDGLVVMKEVHRGGGEMDTFKQGDRVFPGQRFMQIVDTSNMQVEASINQAESGLFRVGQKATITFDAFGGLRLPGSVFSMGALATAGSRQQDYIRNIPVRIKIEGTDPRLIPDLSAGVDVEISRQENTTLVSRAAIQSEAGKQYAFVRTAEGFQRREVQVGELNSTHAAVVSGLRPGEIVRLN